MHGRVDLMDWLARRLVRLDPGHPLRVGIDGMCGAGKTMFAAELVRTLVSTTDRPVVRLDPDGFHNTRVVRHRQGSQSARGYYDDAFDFEALRVVTLEPLGAGGSRRYASHVHDLVSDAVEPRWDDAAPNAIVVHDGTFLQRGALREQWDVLVYLRVPRSTAVDRTVARETEQFGGAVAARSAVEDRYMAACDLYVAEEAPEERADLVVDNTDLSSPYLVDDAGIPHRRGR